MKYWYSWNTLIAFSALPSAVSKLERVFYTLVGNVCTLTLGKKLVCLTLFHGFEERHDS